MDLKLNVAPKGWFSDEEGPLTGPLTKKQKLQLESRFKTATEEDLGSYTEKQAPKNTNYSTTWAVRNFLDWIKQRNLRFPTVPVPEALLTSGTAKQLDRWLSFYVLETRNNKGKPYPPKTLYQLLCGLLRHMRGINPNTPNFLDKTNPSYKKLHPQNGNIQLLPQFCSKQAQHTSQETSGSYYSHKAKGKTPISYNLQQTSPANERLLYYS